MVIRNFVFVSVSLSHCYRYLYADCSNLGYCSKADSLRGIRKYMLILLHPTSASFSIPPLSMIFVSFLDI